MVKLTCELGPLIHLGTWWDHISASKPQLQKTLVLDAGPPTEILLSLIQGGAWVSACFKALQGSLKCSWGWESLGHIPLIQVNVFKSLEKKEKNPEAFFLTPNSILSFLCCPSDVRPFGKQSGLQPL